MAAMSGYLPGLQNPFRKDTLEALKGSVSDVQEFLRLALQVRQLDVGIFG